MAIFSANQYILYLLAKREYSEYELRQKLQHKQFDENEIEQAIVNAQLYHWQSDKRFCECYIRYRSQRGYGPKKIKQELLIKGVDNTLINEEIENAEVDWYQLAELLFHKKRPRVWNAKSRQKMWRYMLQHGFTTEHFVHLMKD